MIKKAFKEIIQSVKDQSRVKGITHRFYTYPAGFSPKFVSSAIENLTKKGDVVLDPFCGCGTTIIAAEALKRNWVGIDITNLAIGLVERRLRNSFKKVNFKSNGIRW